MAYFRPCASSPNRDGDTPAESVTTESFSEGCCSGSGRVPRRGASVLKKAKRGKRTLFPTQKQGIVEFCLDRHFSTAMISSCLR
jgi:hypothetical protein